MRRIKHQANAYLNPVCSRLTTGPSLLSAIRRIAAIRQECSSISFGCYLLSAICYLLKIYTTTFKTLISRKIIGAIVARDCILKSFISFYWAHHKDLLTRISLGSRQLFTSNKDSIRNHESRSRIILNKIYLAEVS